MTDAVPRLRLHGVFELRDGAGHLVNLRSRKGIALLTLLATAPGGSRSRAWLAALLWERSDADHAQASLRRELSSLRSTLRAHSMDSILRVDARNAALAMEAYHQHGSGADGAMLEGFDLPGCAAFEDWLRGQRAADSAAAALTAPIPKLKPRIAIVSSAPAHKTPIDISAAQLAMALFDRLTHFPQLSVVLGGECPPAGDPVAELLRQAGEHNAGYALGAEAAVLSESVTLRLRLIDARRREQLWSKEVVADAGSPLDTRAQSLAAQVWSRIDQIERHNGLQRQSTPTDPSYVDYWRATALTRTFRRADLEEAVALTTRLVERFPADACALALHALCLANAAANDAGGDAVAAEARLAYQRALHLAPDNVEVLGHAAGAIMAMGDPIGVAARLIDRAIDLLPTYQPSLFWGGWVDLIANKPVRAIERLQLSLEINPLSGVRAQALAGIGIGQLMTGEMDAAYQNLFDGYVQSPLSPLAAAGLCIAAIAVGEQAVAHQVAHRLKETGGLAFIRRTLQEPAQRAMFEHALAAALAPPP